MPSLMRLTALFAFATLLFAASCGPTSQQCGPDNCTGCCSAAGVCEPGSSTNSCGEGGGLCSACSGSDVCTNHSCAPPVVVQCNASNCAGGCCDANNVCQTGDADTACGTNGASCASCTTGNACVANACTPTAQPITATAETWTWVGFPDSACGNGAATGIGVNLTTRSTDVLIYLQGGGACWDPYTCGPLNTATAINSGYGASDFTNDGTKSAAPFSRATASNPFKNMSYVYVPYCTGDVHAGDAVTTYPATGQVPEKTVHHKGAANMRAYLARLAATFPSATRVFVSGSSAGAYGAEFNFAAVKAAFPGAEVHVLADCGQMINPAGSTLSQWVAAWNLQVPASCTDCASDFTRYPAWLFSTYPESRFALLAYTQDGVLRQFFGYQPADFETQTRALLTSDYDPSSNAKYYLVAGDSHVMLGNLNTITNNNVTLLDWTSAFVSGTGWASVSPP